MKILVTGSSGMLGSDLVMELLPRHEISGFANRPNKYFEIPFELIDMTKRDSVLTTVDKFKPQIIIHTAAHVDADDCEKNPDRAFAINSEGTRWVAEAAAQVGAILIFISSDYVFNGKKEGLYQESDSPDPLSVYGKSKVLAENFLRERNLGFYIIRPSWLFGENGPNFFRAILKKMAAGENLRVVDDQIGAPTYTKDLSQALRIVAEKALERNDRKGIHIYHLANAGKTSWFEAAKILLSKTNSKVRLDPMPSNQLDRAAKRPHNSVFDMTKIQRDFGIKMRLWNEALQEYWNQSLSKEWGQLLKQV